MAINRLNDALMALNNRIADVVFERQTINKEQIINRPAVEVNPAPVDAKKDVINDEATNVQISDEAKKVAEESKKHQDVIDENIDKNTNDSYKTGENKQISDDDAATDEYENIDKIMNNLNDSYKTGENKQISEADAYKNMNNLNNLNNSYKTGEEQTPEVIDENIDKNTNDSYKKGENKQISDDDAATDEYENIYKIMNNLNDSYKKGENKQISDDDADSQIIDKILDAVKDSNNNEKADNNKDYDNYWYQNTKNQFDKINNSLNRFAAAKAY